ncbi:Ig-like domain-containing protein [Mycolicibacterium pulveris]|uniref:Ig-like domain-containing protein n=1 Tax=Mycolicibacterium pulveris TaxID=36813 RepID=UPI003CED56C5
MGAVDRAKNGSGTAARGRKGRHRATPHRVGYVAFTAPPVDPSDGRTLSAPSPYARYIGRVGALAVALGVGAAVATGQGAGIARADDTATGSTENSSTADAPSEPTSPTAGEEPSDPALSDDDDTSVDEDDDLDEDTEEVVDEEDAAGEDEIPTTPTHTPEEAVEPTSDSDSEALQEDSATPSPTGASLIDDEPTASVAFEEDEEDEAATTLSEVSASASTSTAEPTEAVQFVETIVDVPAAATLTGDDAAAPNALVNVATTFVGMLVSPFLLPGSDAPAHPSFLWGLLEWARREVHRTFFNRTPTAVADAVTISGMDPTVIDVLGNDTDDEPLKITGFSQPANGTVVLNEDKTFTYTPAAGFNGTDTFTYTVSDAGGPWHLHGLAGLFGRGHTATATVTITAGNLPPVVGENPYQLTANPTSGVVTGRVNVTDPSGDELSYELVTDIDPAMGRVTVDPADGTFAYVPTPESRRTAYESQNEQTVTFTIAVTDGQTSVTVNVTAPISPSQGHPDDDGVLDPIELSDLVTDGTVEVVQNQDGTVRVIDGTFTDDVIRDSADAAQALNRIAELLGAADGFADESDITVETVRQPTQNGAFTEVIYRLGQTVNGVPVLGSEAILITDGNGTVLGVFSSYNDRVLSVNTTPDGSVADESQAEAVATAALLYSLGDILGEDARDSFVASLVFDSDLVIYDPNRSDEPRLMWLVRVSTPLPEDPDPESEQPPAESEFPVVSGRYYIYADGAEAGQIRAESSGLEGLHALTPTVDSARDLWDVERWLNVQRSGNIYVLVDAIRNIRTMTSSGDFVRKGFWGWDRAAVSAHANLADVYDYYQKRLGKRSFGFADRIGLGTGIKITLDGSAQASWYLDGAKKGFHFGDETQRAIDIVAHEFSHAVISDIVGRGYTLGLEGNKESEALNEAYADILGNLIENKTDSGRWTIGEDYRNCSRVPSCGRSMANPVRAKYSAIKSTDSIYAMASVFEYAAFKMMDDPRTRGISNEEWSRVFYNSAQRLHFGAGFDDAANAVISSARSQGFTQGELDAVRSAFAQTEILAPRGYVPPASDGPAPTLVSTIPLAETPLNVTVSRDGRFVYIDSFKATYSPETGSRLVVSITQINTLTGQTHTEVISESAMGGSIIYPYGVAASPDGRYVYLLNGDNSDISVPATVTVFDTITEQFVGTPIPVGNTPAGQLFISPDGSRLYASTMNPGGQGIPAGRISVIDTSTKTITHTIPVGYVLGVTFGPDGSRAYATAQQVSATGMVRPVIKVINTTTSTVLREITVGDYRSMDDGAVYVAQVEASADNRRLYALVIDTQEDAYVYSVRVYDTATGAVLDTYENVGAAYGSIGQRGKIMVLSKDGQYLYTRDAATMTLKVIDTRTGQYVGDPVPYETASPSVADMLISPDGKHLYFIGPDSAGGGMLHVFDL